MKESFYKLIDTENIDIKINPENFDPEIRIDGYDSPFNDLSGGEKSSLSLAYRIALNRVINSKNRDTKTADLLILDEPTDGFSEQQVHKMQDLLDSLPTKQTIIISHERMLDSLVSKVIDFKKQNHETKIALER